MIALNPERELLGFLLLGAWAGYVAYRLEVQRTPVWVHGYLVLKILAAWAFGWIYYSYYCHGDTLKIYSTAARLWYYLVHEPGTGVALLFREWSAEFEEIGWQVYYRDIHFHSYDYDYSPPVNYRFMRLTLPLYVAAGGGYYGMQGLMGLLSGLLWYGAYRQWRQVIPIRDVWVVGFFLLPSALFWGSGVLRESVGLPLMLYGAGWIASQRNRPSPGAVLGLLAAMIVMGLVRQEGLILALAVGAGYRLPWQRWWLWGLASGLAWLTLWAVSDEICAYRSYWLSPRERIDLLEGAHVFRIDCLVGGLGSVWSWMQGAWYGLTGPYLWQAKKGVVLLSAIEMLGIWLLAVRGLWGKWLRWRGQPLFLIGLGGFVVGVIAMAMPYWGAVVRQRLYGFYLVWLGLAGLKEGAKEPKSGLS